MYVYNVYCIPVDTQRRFDVSTTLFDRYERWMDVKVTSCACWDAAIFLFLIFLSNGEERAEFFQTHILSNTGIFLVIFASCGKFQI